MISTAFPYARRLLRRSARCSTTARSNSVRENNCNIWLKMLDIRITVAVVHASGANEGPIFRRVNRLGKVWGEGITPKAIWHIVKAVACQAGIRNLAAHDLRRTCTRLCHLAGGELEQIQFLLGHASIETTERYLGCKQKLRHAVNDAIGLEDA